MQRIHFILLQGFIIFHRETTFAIGPNEPFGRSISLHRAPPRPQTKASTGAAQTIIIQVAPPRPQSEANTCAVQAIMIQVAPAESRSAGCGARRKAVRLSGRRHGVAPWASVKLPLRPAFRSQQACPSKVRQARTFLRECPSKVRQAQAFLREYPSREAQARACPEASRPNPRPRSPSKARVLPAYRRPWANRPVARWRRASFCRAARSSRRGPSQRGRDECATRGGTPRAPA